MGGSAPVDQEADEASDDDPARENDALDLWDSEELELYSGEEELDPELTEQAVQEAEEDPPLDEAEEADEPEDFAGADDDDDDGVDNQIDECPNTARAARVDVTGCVANPASEDNASEDLAMLPLPVLEDLDDEAIAGVCGQGLGLLELSCMLSFAAMFGASGRRRRRRASSISRR